MKIHLFRFIFLLGVLGIAVTRQGQIFQLVSNDHMWLHLQYKKMDLAGFS